MRGYCRDEYGEDIAGGETHKDGVERQEECAEFCMKEPVPLGCEYNFHNKRCIAHNYNVRWNNEDANGLCSIIIPEGIQNLHYKLILGF